MRRCVIFGGGELKDIRFTQSLLREDDYIVCADRGYAYCAAMGRKPDLILGDFDSYNGKLPPGCEVLRYPIEKDDTDTMLAVREGLREGCEEFHIYGGTGGKRLDHTLANFQALLYLRRHGARGYLYDDDFCWTAIENETLTLERQVDWGIVSLFPQDGAAEGVTLTGLQYPLADARLTPDVGLAVSNHFLAERADITVRKGALLVGWQLPPL